MERDRRYWPGSREGFKRLLSEEQGRSFSRHVRVRSSEPPCVIALEKLSHDRAEGEARLRGTLYYGALPNRGLNVIDECIDDHVLEIDAASVRSRHDAKATAPCSPPRVQP